MFNSDIDINLNYFFMPFGPVKIDLNEIDLKYSIIDNLYYHKKTNSKWKKCLLYNTGWGQPDGFERLPELNFEDLIKLALKSDYRTTKLSISEEESNKYGSIAIIMERHVDELIDFLTINLENEQLFQNDLYRHNLTLFCFDTEIARSNGGIGNQTYEEILNHYPKWLEISKKVREKIYSK